MGPDEELHREALEMRSSKPEESEVSSLLETDGEVPVAAAVVSRPPSYRSYPRVGRNAVTTVSEMPWSLPVRGNAH